MERIQTLDRYQKSILLLLIGIVLVFTVIYPTVIGRVGFAYQDTILVPGQEDGKTIYSGKIHGEEARFTVLADRSVTFQYGSRVYGPYTAREDASAIAQIENMRDAMTGVELRNGEEVIFRGGVLPLEDGLWLFREDGSLEDFALSVVSDNGILMDENGEILDPMEPSAAAILEVMGEPVLSHKGSWLGWCAGVFFSIVTAVTILFADELFRLKLAFRVRDVQAAEPSDWEIAGRYISWTILPVMLLYLFILGLR